MRPAYRRVELRRRLNAHQPQLEYPMAAVAAAIRANSKSAHAARFLLQIARWIAASVRHADATIDQMTVTQLILPVPWLAEDHA